MSLYVGVDSGTQSVKVVALDLETGRVIAEARAPHRTLSTACPRATWSSTRRSG